ncbi:Bug family tripartite tricarboxylate transporter substrate binding protein [Roseomonas harenae]|uniref:Bug family tripartite tricarboxylate transporter substrate binding protein n=1 Tax=Muricoccus harenae TaxID=2692566 RepID=UPI00133126D3|nr:tripartite tricarboxylate transporter substrate-binding protein [Roseomonas harenae]
MDRPHRPLRVTRRPLLGLGVAALLPGMALAQGSFPAHPLTIVVPYGAGSTNDILARLLATNLGAKLGQPVVVDNRVGAGGTLGIGQVVRSQPDGHTLALVSASSIPINRALYRSIPFDPARDLALVSITNSTPNALIVSADHPAKSLADLVALAKQPGAPPLRYFSPGNGTSQHLSCVQFQKLVGAEMEHIPYRGPGEAITGMMAGETAFGFASVPSVVGLVRDGRLRALGTTGPRPSALPGVPTLVALGYGSFADTDVWYGIAAPKGIPETVRTTLREALQAIVTAPTLRDRLSAAGFDPVPPMTAVEGDAFVTRQVSFWADLVQQSGAKLD